MTVKISKIVRRGEIWLADLRFGAIGSEQGEMRPVLIVQMTSKVKNNLPTHVMLDEPCLSSISIALVEQIKTIDKGRLIKYIGTISDNNMHQVNNAIKIQIGLESITA